jgi:8-oxo-dGTP diphosphatase
MGCRTVTTYVVVAAAILDGDPPRLLAAQRSYPPAVAGMWELPGGKTDRGEDERAALARECEEELGVQVEVGERAADDVTTLDGQGVLRTYWATLADGGARPQPLEHTALRWLSVDELYDVPWLPADLPVVAELRNGITSRP